MDQKQLSSRIFTYSEEAEKNSGALTMRTLSYCLGAAAPIFLSINMAGTSLFLHFAKNTSHVYASDIWMKDTIPVTAVLVFIFFVLFIPYESAGLSQLLSAYAVMDGNRLVKLRFRGGSRVYHAVNHSLGMARAAGATAEFTRAGSRHIVAGAARGALGVRLMKNYDFVSQAVEHCDENRLMFIPLKNIELLSDKKKYIQIEADMELKGKMRRKKIKIYKIYHDMDTLVSVCKGGGRLYVS